MSDAEEEVKTHPCDKYKIPDCPGMITNIWDHRGQKLEL